MSAKRFRAVRLTAIAIVVATVLAALGGPALAADGPAFVADANQKRLVHDRAPVAWNAIVDQVTVARGNQMAANDSMVHDMAYVERRLRELGVCFTGYGEIIYAEHGHGAFDPQRAVDAWYASTSGHKEIMLGNYTVAAGSWSRNPTSGRTFAVMVWVKTCGFTPPPASDPGESVRVAGADRYATAAALSALCYAPGVPVAYVATGSNFPDALAAGPAAAHAGGPVLLVRQSELPDATATELTRLRPGRIVVLGASAVVSDEVADALRPYATSGQVSRIAGADRYATAALISEATFVPGGAVVYVATGANFPDALAGGAAAGLAEGPILLVKRDEVPATTAAELQRLHPARIVVLGSSAVVSDAVVRAMANLSGAQVSRIFGADRYATSASLSRSNYAADGPSKVFVATGATFPDGLAGSPVAGSLPGPLLLVSANSLPSVVAAELLRLAPDTVVVLGGSGAISNGVLSAINAVVP
jgi:putative cell wall-binding protein